MEIKRFIGGILEANCYVVSPRNAGDSKAGCFIIDPGYDPARVIKYIRENAFAPEGIILTHHHADHSGAAARLRKELDCPVMIHREDADMFREGADRLLEDGDVLTIGDGSKGSPSGTVKLVVLHTPGHTRGGICLMAERDRACFTGDTIFNVDLGRTDLEDGSYREMADSILNVVNKWGNDLTIYPGHGDPATMKTVRKINHEFLEIVNGN